jgi:transposase
MNSNRYIELLRENFIGSARTLFGKDYIFAQDNAPCHVSRATRNFFEEEGIELLPWPACSPDLNPIENLWSIMKQNVGIRFQKTKTELEAFSIDEWSKIPQETVKKVIMSMTSRIKQVIERNERKSDY